MRHDMFMAVRVCNAVAITVAYSINVLGSIIVLLLVQFFNLI